MGAIGILEVQLVEAKGLDDTDFLGDMDPYVLIQYKSQERKSSVARGDGAKPAWNEEFSFRIEYPGADDQYKLTLKIMDKDTFSADDFVGEATIYLKDLFELGFENGCSEQHPTRYRVITTDNTYCGELQVGLKFTPKAQGITDREDYGGWAQSED
ncbi:unnamed protein product [Rhodiola kirilowii]